MRLDIWPYSSFLNSRWCWVFLEGKSPQEYPVNIGVPQGSILGPALFPLHINDLPDDVICKIVIYADTSIYKTLDWAKKWLADFSAGKTQLVLFDHSNNTGSIDVKMDGSVCEEKSSFKMLRLSFSFKLDWGSYIISIAKSVSKKIGALICSMKFLSAEVALYLCSKE